MKTFEKFVSKRSEHSKWWIGNFCYRTNDIDFTTVTVTENCVLQVIPLYLLKFDQFSAHQSILTDKVIF